jgi:polyphosphate glucokinase
VASTEPAPHGPIAIGIDVGGTGIKGAAVDTASGNLVSERIRVLTPQPATPQACIRVITRIVSRISKAYPEAAGMPVGCGVPAVVIDGVTKSAANIDPGWVDFDADAALEKVLKRPVFMVNDADAAGTAEMRLGAGRGRIGTVIVLTLGTGVGSAIYVDGRLVPNTELGHLKLGKKDAERVAADSVRETEGLSWKQWAKRLDAYFQYLEALFSPDLIIVGGGVSKKSEKYLPLISTRVDIVPAQLLNEAGIVGAAVAAKSATPVAG